MRFLALVVSFVAALTLAGCFEGQKGEPAPPGPPGPQGAQGRRARRALKERRATKARRATPGETLSLRRLRRRNDGVDLPRRHHDVQIAPPHELLTVPDEIDVAVPTRPAAAERL